MRWKDLKGWRFLILGMALLLILGCCATTGLGVLGYNQYTADVTPEVTAEPSISLEEAIEACKPNGLESYNAETGAFVCAEPVEEETEELPHDCGTFEPGETRMLEPGQSVAGDVLVDRVKRYNEDSRIEGTVVINRSDSPVEVTAPWGAGCVATDDVEYMTTREFATGCGDRDKDGTPDGCPYVREVVVTDAGVDVTVHEPDE